MDSRIGLKLKSLILGDRLTSLTRGRLEATVAVHSITDPNLPEQTIPYNFSKPLRVMPNPYLKGHLKANHDKATQNSSFVGNLRDIP